MGTNGSKGREGIPGAGPGAALVAGVLLALPGCLILGRQQTDQPVVPEKVAQVQKGMTKDQVTDLLGAPQEIIFSNKALDPLREHAYVYEYKAQKATAIFLGVVNFGNLDSKRDRVVVFFGEDGKVINVGQSLYGKSARYGFPFGR